MCINSDVLEKQIYVNTYRNVNGRKSTRWYRECRASEPKRLYYCLVLSTNLALYKFLFVFFVFVYTHKYLKPRWMSDLDTVAHNFPLPTTACRVVMNIFCRESRVEDEVAEELWASSRATAADCLETNYRDGAAVVHSRGNVGLAAACSNQAERLLPPWRRLRNRPNLFIRISFFADRCNGPTHIRSLDKLSTFKRQLKSHLFQSAFAA